MRFKIFHTVLKRTATNIELYCKFLITFGEQKVSCRRMKGSVMF